MSLPCDCCEGPNVLTPVATENQPGLSRLSYRAGTHATFFETMQARLSSAEFPEMVALKTRDKNDPSIALLDAWAVVADVLTFYQERIANEGYLRTATERRSILELARLVGYVLRPGVASSVYLAYTIEKSATEPAEIPAGARVNSVPGPGEQMQAFETTDPLEAHWEWNELKPRLWRPQVVTPENADHLEVLYFVGLSTGLKPNDLLLLDFSNAQKPRKVASVETLPAPDPINGKDRTKVVLLPSTNGTEKELLQRVRTIAARFADTDDFDVSRDREMTQRVLDILGELKEVADADTAAKLAAGIHDNYLPRLREELIVARQNNFSRLEPWVGKLVGELERDVVPLIVSMGKAVSLATDRRERAVESVAPLQGLTKTLNFLVQPPSLPPANSLRLPRDTVKAFAMDGDNLPRVLAAITPRLQPVLYQAWKNVPIAPPEPLNAYALRLKTAPFGHNAPLKLVFDGRGAVIGQEEWPIAVGAITEVKVDLNEFTVDISGTDGTARYAMRVDSDSDRDDTWNSFTEVSAKNQLGSDAGGVQAHFSRVEQHTTTIERESGDSFDINVGESHFKNVGRGQILQRTVDARRISIEWISIRQTEQEALVIKVEQLTPASLNVLPLDAAYDQIIPGTWIVIDRADTSEKPLVTQIKQVQTVSKAAYGLTGKSTVLTLRNDWLTKNDLLLSVFRATTVYVLTEELQLAEEPVTDAVCGQEIELGDLYDGLDSGRWLVVSGERIDCSDSSAEKCIDSQQEGAGVGGVRATELVMLGGVRQDVARIRSQNGEEKAEPEVPLPGDFTHSFVQLSDRLAYCYKRDTVTIYGNVVKATHGETRQEVLGGGDAAKALQQFTLRQPPLTYVSAPTVSGVESTLVGRVNDVKWRETENLVALEPSSRSFIIRTDDEARTTLIFGNGERGARLPTGQENVRATYRNGIGNPGNVKAGQISLLSTRPLGVKEVINPIRASGGADKESRDQARKNAPLALMALDRLVSTRDYADFARTFAGIGKAAAVRLTDGRRQLLHVTIAGAEDIPVETTSDLYRNLRDALRRYGDPHLPIRIEVRERLALIISANVRVHPDYLWEKLEPNIRAAVLDSFGFEKLELGTDLLLSNAMRAIQAISGVTYVDVDTFDTISEADLLQGLATSAALNLGRKDRVSVDPARVEQSAILPAQIAYLATEVPDTLMLQEIKS